MNKLTIFFIIIFLIILIVLSYVYVIQEPVPTESSINLSSDMLSYKSLNLPILCLNKNFELDLINYAKIHDYILISNIKDLNRFETCDYVVLMENNLSNDYQNLEELVHMSDNSKIIFTPNFKLFIVKRDCININLSIEENMELIKQEILNQIYKFKNRYTYNIKDDSKSFEIKDDIENIKIKNRKDNNLNDLDLEIKNIIVKNNQYKTLYNNGIPVIINKLCILNDLLIFSKRNNKIVAIYPNNKINYGCMTKHIKAIKKGKNQMIPKNIYQTFETLVIPQVAINSAYAWNKLNPDYSYNYYTGEDCRNFIKKYFDQRVLRAYDQLKAGAYKADLWRCCILYQFGGIYTDVKMFPKIPLSSFIKEKNELILVIDLKLSIPLYKSGIYNAFMASTPEHPFIKMVIEKIVDNVENKIIPQNSLSLTGPILLYEVYLNYLKKINNKDIKFLPGEYDNDKFVFFKLHFNTNNKFVQIKNAKNEILLYNRNPFDKKINNSILYKNSSGKPHYANLFFKREFYENI